jgi:MFS family permease
VDGREPVDEGDTEGHAVARFSRAGAAFRRVAIDITPLRESRAFRLLTFGQLISLTGRQVSTVALPIQIYALTQSSLALGLVGLVQIVPLTVFSIWGGTWADRFDRRKLILASECGLALTSVLLLAGALAGNPPVWYLYAVVAIQTGFFAVNFPARNAVVPSVVGRERLPAALALNQVMYNTTLVVGPAAAGFIIGAASSTTTGVAIAYGLDVVTFVASIGTTIALPRLPPQRTDDDAEEVAGWESVKEGFRFLRGKRVLISTFVIDLIAMIFGMPRALFPVLALEVFHRGPAAVGLMYAAPAFGAVVGALTTGWVGRVKHQGLAVIWAVAAWGATITLFGFSGNYFWLGLFLLALAGAADMISAVFRGTILQLGVPDELRGRLSAVHILVVTGGPRLGDFESGGVAAMVAPFFTAGGAAIFSVVTGGLACLVGTGIVALRYPELRRYHAET